MSEVLLHGHHEVLLTWGRGYEERLEQIRRVKSPWELPTRERLMRVLTEEELAALPLDVLQAWRARAEAGRAYDEVERAYDAAWRAYDEAERACAKAERDNAPALDAWHQRVCSCPARAANRFSIFGG